MNIPVCISHVDFYWVLGAFLEEYYQVCVAFPAGVYNQQLLRGGDHALSGDNVIPT